MFANVTIGSYLAIGSGAYPEDGPKRVCVSIRQVAFNVVLTFPRCFSNAYAARDEDF